MHRLEVKGVRGLLGVTGLRKRLLQLTGSVCQLTALVAGTIGCGPELQPQATCPAENEVQGACAGVPASALCDTDTCTTGVSCSNTKAATDDASLAAAIQSAGPGTCI